MARVSSDLAINETTRALEALRARGVDILDLTVSNPTRVGFEYPPDLLAGLAAPASLQYDPQPCGLWSARQAVAADFQRRGLTVAPDQIALTASTSEAYAFLFKLLCDPGDVVLVPRPSYPLFEHLTMLEGVVAHGYRLEYHGGWRLDIGEIRDAIDERTRAVLVVSPNNPTGSFLHRDDLEALDMLCSARNLMLIGDEVFADYPLCPSPHAASVLHASRSVTCSLGGLSKSVGLPQVKLGWIALAGPAPQRARLMTAYELIADTYLSVSTPAQVALPDLLARGAMIRAQIQTRLARNLQRLREAVAAAPALSVLEVEGGWSAVVRVPSFRGEEVLVLELLTTDQVLVHPGFFFDFAREAFVVVSLLVEPAIFDEGVRRLVARASQPGNRI